MLIDDVDKHVDITPSRVSTVFHNASEKVCHVCGHNRDSIPWPIRGMHKNSLEDTPLSPAKPLLNENVYNPWNYSEEIISFYTCPFTNKSIVNDPNVVLGIGFNIVTDDVCMIKSDFQVISYEAFKDMGVRTTPYGYEFTRFMPLAINEYHYSRSSPMFNDLILELFSYIDDKYERIVILTSFVIYGVFCTSENHVSQRQFQCINMMYQWIYSTAVYDKEVAKLQQFCNKLIGTLPFSSNMTGCCIVLPLNKRNSDTEEVCNIIASCIGIKILRKIESNQGTYRFAWSDFKNYICPNLLFCVLCKYLHNDSTYYMDNEFITSPSMNDTCRLNFNALFNVRTIEDLTRVIVLEEVIVGAINKPRTINKNSKTK